jgi:hypothetical protein
LELRKADRKHTSTPQGIDAKKTTALTTQGFNLQGAR